MKDWPECDSHGLLCEDKNITWVPTAQTGNEGKTARGAPRPPLGEGSNVMRKLHLGHFRDELIAKFLKQKVTNFSWTD